MPTRCAGIATLSRMETGGERWATAFSSVSRRPPSPRRLAFSQRSPRESRNAGTRIRYEPAHLANGYALIISAAGMFFFYSNLGLGQTHLGLILAHAVLGTPFVVISVTATLAGFDNNLVRAGESLGGGPFLVFRRIQLPLIAPGVISGALFAFAVSFDEVVTVLFLGGLGQRTVPRQMWTGIREQISPEILAVATFLVVFALLLLGTVEWLRGRGGVSASGAD